MEVVNFVRPEGAVEGMFRLADEIVPELEALGDDAGLARAWRMRAYAQNVLAQYGASSEALERGLAHAERADDAVIRSEILAWLPTRLARGPMPTGQALKRCRELLEHAQGDLPAESGALAGVALIQAMLGRFDEAREVERRSRAIKEDLGLVLPLAIGDIWRGEMELYAGDLAAAEQAFGAAAEFLDARGDRNFYPTAMAGVARARFHQERYEEADVALRSAEETTASDDFITVVWTLGTRARFHALEGRVDEAVACAEHGVELASRTDDLNLQAEALVELADVTDSSARADALERALELAERKNNVVYVARLRGRLAR
jgi:tetratricopeptide (TPR) repeat protein